MTSGSRLTSDVSIVPSTTRSLHDPSDVGRHCSRGPNDEVERREAAQTTEGAVLSQSSTFSLPQRRRGPRYLEPNIREFPVPEAAWAARHQSAKIELS